MTIGKPKTDDESSWEGTGGTASRSTTAPVGGDEEGNRIVHGVPPEEIPPQQLMQTWPHGPTAPPVIPLAAYFAHEQDPLMARWHARVQAMEATQAARNHDDRQARDNGELNADFTLPSVWITKTGHKYHSERCTMLSGQYKKAKKGTRLFKKLTPCSQCSGWIERRAFANNSLEILPGCFSAAHNRLASVPDDDW